MRHRNLGLSASGWVTLPTPKREVHGSEKQQAKEILYPQESLYVWCIGRINPIKRQKFRLEMREILIRRQEMRLRYM